MAEIGSKGGQAQVKKGFGTLSREERAANAKKAAEARWANKKPKVKVKGKKTKNRKKR